mmetsp:Transcript_1065/g.2851  ORF Transcript_1065/g.2851 Transcript_1065/m.2851 type:complete len:148 (-) Transcript_1065:232-675(-)
MLFSIARLCSLLLSEINAPLCQRQESAGRGSKFAAGQEGGRTSLGLEAHKVLQQEGLIRPPCLGSVGANSCPRGFRFPFESSGTIPEKLATFFFFVFWVLDQRYEHSVKLFVDGADHLSNRVENKTGSSNQQGRHQGIREIPSFLEN